MRYPTVFKKEFMGGPTIPKRFTPGGKLMALQVIPFSEEEQRKGEVLLPQNMRSTEGLAEAPRAWVIAVGPDVKQFKEGDMVVGHPKQELGQIKVCGDVYVMMNEEYCMGAFPP
jgi:hypothetical protein